MLRAENIIKDIEDNLLDGSDLIESLVYDQEDNNSFAVYAQIEAIDFVYKINGFVIIRTSIPYEMFWEPSIAKEIMTSVINDIITVGKLGKEYEIVKA